MDKLLEAVKLIVPPTPLSQVPVSPLTAKIEEYKAMLVEFTIIVPPLPLLPRDESQAYVTLAPPTAKMFPLIVTLVALMKTVPASNPFPSSRSTP